MSFIPRFCNTWDSLPRFALSVEEFTEQSGISAQFHCTATPEAVPPEVATSLYRMTQQALRNIIQHAQARQATVLLAEKWQEIVTWR